MNERLRLLLPLAECDEGEKEFYKALYESDYLTNSADTHCKKAQFLTRFADGTPIVIDRNELILGSMRFCRAPCGPCSMGHIVVDYRTILALGLPGIEHAILNIKTEYRPSFWSTWKAFTVLIERYAEKASQMNMTRQSLLLLSLLQRAPQSFHEALQLVWLVHLFLHAEGNSAAFSFGRFDQYLFPFLKSDLQSGALSLDDAKELIACFFIKTLEGDESQALTVGGDSENELTYLTLEVMRELKIRQPSICVRTCEATSERLWREIIALIQSGIGMPSIFNDAPIKRALERRGISPTDAQNYAIVGCYEANADGHTYGTSAAVCVFYLHEPLLAFLSECAEYDSFASFFDAFKAYLAHTWQEKVARQCQEKWKQIERDYVSPFESICFGDCLHSGIPAELGGCRYTMAGINVLGIGTLTDSLLAIKRLVFDTQQYSYATIQSQLKENFSDAALLSACRSLSGKFGSNKEESNTLAHKLSCFIADLADATDVASNVIPYAGLFAFLHDVNCETYGATPDGRRMGERISYGVGASELCREKSTTSVLLSAAHIAQDRFADGTPLLLRLSESTACGEHGGETMRSLIESYFAAGGAHLHINVADSETLRAAQAEPEKYSDLIVRISGYSDHFIKISKKIQNSLIERT